MNLPKAEISRDEAMKLWTETRSDYAKEQFVLANLPLVTNALKSLHLNMFDEDLYSIGFAGLIKATNRFDANKGTRFSTFAVPVIRNEILQSFRKKPVNIAVSLDEMVDISDDSEKPYGDIIPDGVDIEGNVLRKLAICETFDGLKSQEKEVFLLKFKYGKTQTEIARIMGMSQTNVHRLLKRINDKFRKETEE